MANILRSTSLRRIGFGLTPASWRVDLTATPSWPPYLRTMGEAIHSSSSSQDIFIISQRLAYDLRAMKDDRQPLPGHDPGQSLSNKYTMMVVRSKT